MGGLQRIATERRVGGGGIGEGVREEGKGMGRRGGLLEKRGMGRRRRACEGSLNPTCIHLEKRDS